MVQAVGQVTGLAVRLGLCVQALDRVIGLWIEQEGHRDERTPFGAVGSEGSTQDGLRGCTVKA